MVGELNRQQDCSGTLVCGVGDRNGETKTIAGQGGTNWLWSGNASTNISVALQNSLIADAQARAQAAKPANKSLRRINYTGGIVVGRASYVFVGATATYSQCDGVQADPR